LRLSRRNQSTGGPPKRAARLLAVALSGVLAASIAAGILLFGSGGEEPRPSVRATDFSECRGLPDDAARSCYTQMFTRLVSGRDDPRPVVQAIADSAWSEGGFVLSNCHGVMHPVGRAYAREAEVTLATLMDYLPRSNDPGCSAGFAHGLVTGVAPQIDPRRPREANTVCADAGTRYQRYSCVHGFGHAFMRMGGDRLRPALELCAALGPRAAPDCAQGVYHDYWFAVIGADDARLPGESVTDPRKLCAAQPAAFVRACWYRAFVDNRPEGFLVESPADFDGLCQGLDGLQRAACITATSVIGPPDPALQLRLCAELDAPSDAENCIRGTKVQNLLGRPTTTYVRLIRECGRFTGPTRATCYRLLGKSLAVLTDGEFGRAGCPQLEAEARRSCGAGARSMDEALVTFS
jgi:hypothetical protein